MIADAENSKLLIVVDNGVSEIDDPRIILEMGVSFHETAVELHNQGKGELFALGVVQTAGSLDDL